MRVLVALRHLGAFGLFFWAILDSLPLPIFGGSDILTAILAASHHDPWYEYAAVAAAGSLMGAFITFTLARRAGLAYLHSKFGSSRVPDHLEIIREVGYWGSRHIHCRSFPVPSQRILRSRRCFQHIRKYLAVVGVCRAVRYSLLAILADHYGHHFIRVIRHPVQYWGWLLLSAAIITGVVSTGIVINRRLETSSSTG